MKRTRRRQDKQSEKGATMVEFSIISALVLLLVFGIMEFALIFLQEHFVANAAREGLRIGVRANNYDCYKTVVGPGYDACTFDRATQVNNAIESYLSSIYTPDDITINLQSLDIDATTEVRPVLEVNVQTPNFFPPLISSLANILPGIGGSNINNPETIAFTTRLEYEAPDEYIEEPP